MSDKAYKREALQTFVNLLFGFKIKQNDNNCSDKNSNRKWHKLHIDINMHAEQHCYYNSSIYSNQSYNKETKQINMYIFWFHYKNDIHSKEKKIAMHH